MKVRAVDMGGHEIARKMWLQYSHEADGIVYIVDAVDRERFPEAALELHKLLAAQALPPGAPVLILANKVDLPHANVDGALGELRDAFDIVIDDPTEPPLCISAKTGVGCDELLPAIREGLDHDGITIIDVPVDYSENPKLFDTVHWRGLH